MTYMEEAPMNAHLAIYEKRLRDGADALERMESTGEGDTRYKRSLCHWLELLAAYEYEYEVVEAGSTVSLAAVI